MSIRLSLWPRCFLCSALVVLSICAGPFVEAQPSAVVTDAPRTIEQVRAALAQGNLDAVDAWLRGAPAERLALSRLAPGDVEMAWVAVHRWIRSGRWQEAASLLARMHAAQPDPRAVTLHGELLVAQGRMQEAIALLDPIVESPDGSLPAARYWRAVAFGRSGRPSRAALEWRDLIRLYNRGQAPDAESLRYVALAAQRLGAWTDANRTFREALAADPQSVEIRRDWAALFLEKYRPDEALTLLDEAIALRANDPDLLALRATVELDLRYGVDAARAYVEEARQVFPDHPAANEVLASIGLDGRDWETIDTALAAALRVAPARLETLTLQAASHWLRDDLVRFRAIEEQVLALDPTYAAFHHTVGEVGARNFRYAEALALFEQSLDVQADYPPALLSLGVGYSRIADDERAAAFLARAFDSDPFNERALRMVELFERTIPQYEVVQDSQIPAVRYRFWRPHVPVMQAYVPPVVQRTWAVYIERYGLTPPAPLSIEFLYDQPTFSIRSVGLPGAAQHGICFGHLITSRSPHEGDFNWRQVLEHEMSHVFSLHASRWRVPRWLTEGLAEYDTILSNPRWRREEELAIAREALAGRYIGVMDLNDAFVSVDDFGRILAAYFQASLVVEYIGDRWGYPKLVEMLGAYGRSLETPEVFRTVLEIEVPAFDADFQEHLRAHLGPLLQTWEPSLPRLRDAPRIEEAVATRPSDPDAVAEFGGLLLRRGDREGAARQLDAALQLSPRNARALFLRATMRLAAEDAIGARQDLLQLREDGRDGWTIRVGLALGAEAAGDLADAISHLERAVEIDPRGVEAWAALAELFPRVGQGARAQEALERWASLDQNAAEPAMRLAQAYLAANDTARALDWALHVVDIAPFVRDTHTVAGRAAHAAAEWTTAVRELQLELAQGAADRDATLSMLADALAALGRAEEAEAVRRQR